MTRAQRLGIYLTAFSLTLSIPFTVAIILLGEPRFLILIGILVLANTLWGGVRVIRELRNAHQRVERILVLWTSGAVILPISVFVLHTGFGLKYIPALVISLGISMGVLVIALVYIVHIVRKI